MIPEATVLGLTRVVLRPEFSAVTGRVDRLSEKIRSACGIRVRLLSGQEKILGDLCSGFITTETVSYMRNDEVGYVKEAIRENLSLIQPPRLFIRSYGFGLTSYRALVTVKPKVGNWIDLLSSWRELARAFREILKSRVSSKVSRGSLASHCFSEIYTFYELEFSPQEVMLKWREELEDVLMPDQKTLSSFLSPLKISDPPAPRLSFAPDPLYSSRDGIFHFLYYSRSGPGNRRNVHQVRRKRRKLLRKAIDFALGLKVYLENEDLWLKGGEIPWGALVGMIHLNPKVVIALHRAVGAKFLRPYKEMLNSLELIEKFEAYENSFWYPFQSEEQILILNQAVRLLGGKPPGRVTPVPLLPREVALLKILMIKCLLDEILVDWSEDSLECLSRLLCAYARSVLSPSSNWVGSSDESEVKVIPGEPIGSCASELLGHLRARKSRKGLTASELSVLLKHSTDLGEGGAQRAVRSWIGKMTELELLIRSETRRGRSRKTEKRIIRGIPVTSFSLDFENPSVEPMRRILERIVEKVARVLEANCHPFPPKPETLFNWEYGLS